MTSKFVSKLFSNTNGSTNIELRKQLQVSPNKSTAIVWDHITPTSENYPGTTIPKSFIISTEGGTFWTHGNATEHINEAILGLKKQPGLEQSNPHLFAQLILFDYREALSKATEDGIRYNRILKVDHWEFKISKKPSDIYPAVVHALFTGLK